MQAAVVTDFAKPLTIEERAVPEPGEGQVLVRIEASGLCHTDIHAARGDWPVRPEPPFVPGHEGVGRVVALGTGVVTRAIGDRVALAWLGFACGHCRPCLGGRETLCEQQRNTGYSVDGAFAEYAVTAADFAVLVPDAVSSRDAAALTCAGVTSYKAMKVSRVQPAELVAVFGIGGLGHLAVQYARLMGALVVAVDIDEAKLQLARELGADYTVNATREPASEGIRRLGGADVALALAPSSRAFDEAFSSLRRGGRVVCVGLPAAGVMTLPIFDTVIGGKSVVGSIVGTRNDLSEVFDLHAAERTKVVSESRHLADVNECIEDVLAGRVPARIVFDL